MILHQATKLNFDDDLMWGRLQVDIGYIKIFHITLWDKLVCQKRYHIKSGYMEVAPHD